MKAYKAYKDSGISWIGQIPQHWDIVEIKKVAKFNPTKKRICFLIAG